MQLSNFDFNKLSNLPRIQKGESSPNKAHFDLGNGKRLDLYVSMEMDGDKAALLALFGDRISQKTVIDFFAANHDSKNFTALLVSVPENKILTSIFNRVDKERERAELRIRNFISPTRGILNERLFEENCDQEIKIVYRGTSWRPWKIRMHDFSANDQSQYWNEDDERNPFGGEMNAREVFDIIASFIHQSYEEMANGKMADFSKLNSLGGMNFSPPI